MRFGKPNYLGIFLCLGVFLLTLALPVRAQLEQPTIAIKSGWLYRWGDSPSGVENVPQWALETPQVPLWDGVSWPGKLPNQNRENILWLAVPLSLKQQPNPHLYLQGIEHLLEVYYQRQKVYIFDELESSQKLKHQEGRFPIISLDGLGSDSFLFLRVYTGDRDRVTLGYDGSPLLGSQSQLVRHLILKDAPRISLGFLFTFCGTMAIVLFLSKRTERTYFSFGLVTLLVGIYTITPTEMVRLIYNYSLTWTYIHHTAFHLIPVSICIFFEHIFGAGYRLIVRRIWQIQLIYTPIGLLIGSFYSWDISVYPTQLISVFGACTLIIIAVKKALGNNQEAKLFTVGFAILMILVIRDLIVYVFSFFFGPKVLLFYWGMLIFTICIAFILESRFTQTQNYLKAYNQASDRFVPHEFLQFLGKSTILDVGLGDRVQKEMAILFSDIRSFTTLSESMSPQENFNFLNAYLERVGPTIRQHQGFIDKYIGDAVMALFPNSAADALKAAIAMQKQVSLFNEESEQWGYPHLKIGIGIHWGKLMLGIIGEEQRIESTVISDAVNLASRLEDATKTFGVGILASDSTLEGLSDRDNLAHRYLGTIRVKGKREPVGVYEIYEADPPELKTFKMQTKSLFEQAIALHERGDREEASQIFQTLWDKNHGDVVVRYYLLQC